MTTIRGLKKLHILTNFQNLQISISEKLKKMERNKALLELYIALLLSKRNMYLSPQLLSFRALVQICCPIHQDQIIRFTLQEFKIFFYAGNNLISKHVPSMTCCQTYQIPQDNGTKLPKQMFLVFQTAVHALQKYTQKLQSSK